MIPAGSPDNPMGKYRIDLTLPLYAIHDTNNPWAVGRLVTHGCIRLYPEDIEQFFDVIRVGSSGEFVYQPVKIGMLYGKVYVEGPKGHKLDLTPHRLIKVEYDDQGKVIHVKRGDDERQEAQRVVRESDWREMVDQALLAKAVREKSGVPVDVTRGSPASNPGEVAIIELR